MLDFEQQNGGSMKKFTVIGAAVAALLATPVIAADMPVKAPVAPTPVAIPYNWTGFYIGGHGGYGWSKKDWTDLFQTQLPTGWTDSDSQNGFFGGLQGGYNYQINQWVFGIEGQVSWTDIKGYGLWRNPAGVITAESAHTDIHMLATLTGRLGIAWDRLLLYAKGGGAWVNEEHWQQDFANGPRWSDVPRATRTGWTVGGGLEYAFWENWSAKIEYDYMDFGTHRFPFVLLTTGQVFRYADITQKVHLVEVGINYRFNWSK